MNHLHVTFNFIRRAAIGLCLAGAMAVNPVTPTAHAQLDGASLAELGRADYLHRDMIIFSQGLEMDDFQRLILDSLFEDYFEKFTAGWEQTQQTIHDLATGIQGGENIDHSRVLEMILKPFDDWREEKKRLKERFEGDVRAILNPEQTAMWPKFFQQMTREKTLHLGRLSGESVNLFHHVRSLRLDETTLMDLEPVMDQYAEELHAALERRNQHLTGMQADALRSLRSYGALPTPTNIPEQVQSRVQVRDINMRYTDLIAERLPDQHRKTFRTNVLEDVSPRVFRQLTAMRTISRAAQMPGLDEETIEAINAVRSQFETELEQINTRLHALLLDFEPRQMHHQAELAAARQRGETIDRLEDPTRNAFAERNERAQHYVAMLHGLLTPEQVRSLPGGERISARRQEDRREAIAERGALDGRRGSDGQRPQRPTRDSDVAPTEGQRTPPERSTRRPRGD